MDHLHIVTVATDSKYYFPHLVESCKRNGKELKVLGFGEKWRGFNWKFKLMLEYIKNLPKDDIVCFVDGYDVLCVRQLNELTNEFLRLKEKHDCKIIVAQDKWSLDIYICIVSLIFGQCKGLSLNSGTYIGYVKDLLPLLEEIYENNPDDTNDDQILLTKYCKKYEEIFHIDTDNEIFFTKVKLLGEINDDIVIENNKIIVDKNHPFFVHTPCGFLDELIINLGYDYDHNNKIKDVLYIELFTHKIVNSLFGKIVFFCLLCIFILYIFFEITGINVTTTIKKKIKGLSNRKS